MVQSSFSSSSARMHGLDLARYLALAGMVAVNFRLALGVEEGASLLNQLISLLEGRAAATFVVLAGLGFNLAFGQRRQPTPVILKRAAFLFVLGLINLLIFEADILHFYAAYFLLGAVILALPPLWLPVIVVALPIGFVGLTVFFNYDAGWDWSNLVYKDLWTVPGFLRNLMFNGWHPVVPWFAFFACGMAIANLSLRERRTQGLLVICGLMLLAASVGFSQASGTVFGPLSGLQPVPPGPYFVMGGCGTAMAVIGLCLLAFESRWLSKIFSGLLPAGRQTLTLYIAHIVIGMGTLEAMGLLGTGTIEHALLATLAFMLIATLFSWLWSWRFKTGPLEALMRKLAG